MKITLNWLRKYVPFEGTAEDLAERLTMLGLEVEGIEHRGQALQGVVVAQVLTRDRHPNADKLSVCRVQDGQGERQIVCGAQNFKAGDKVPLVLPGSTLPPKPGDREPFTIKVGKIRGVESHGMLCSAEELQVDPRALGLNVEDGLLILPADARVGQPFAEFLGHGPADVMLDLEVTPNRPDLNSVIGIAREIAAQTGAPLSLPRTDLAPGPGTVAETVAVRVDAPERCPRYVARVIRGVKIGPSPAWLRQALEGVGLRSINNVVDLTNFVMLETGQPLHAFDLRQVGRDADGRPTIVVRLARDGESLQTLDGKVHSLTAEDLLIADPARALALAGVMGGQNSEVLPDTTDLLLESAYFTPTGIRRTSKRLGLRTDASYRFERGADPLGAEEASRRAASLIVEVAGGTVLTGAVDAAAAQPEPRRITLRHSAVNELLGIELRPEEIDYYLGQLGFRAASRKARSVDDPRPADPVAWEVPSYRVDLKREADLIEEVVRLHGVNRVPSTPPRQARGEHPFDSRYDELMDVRRALNALGVTEVQGQTLIGRGTVPASMAPQIVPLANPLSSDMDVLRPTLISGLLDVCRRNARHQNAELALFEIGRVFRLENGEPREGWRVAVVLTGTRAPAFWKGADRDASYELVDLKGVLEGLFESLGLKGVVYSRRPEPNDLWAESGSVTLGGRLALGEFGQVQPRWARDYDLRAPVLVAELDLGQVLERRAAGRSFKSLPAFPAIRRDVALVLEENVTHEAVVQAVKQAKPANLEETQLFDVFRGQNVPAGHKSVAYRFVYRAPDRTLTDTEVNATHEKVVAQLRTAVGASLRE